MSTTTLSKWGNSTAIRIPTPILKQLQLKPGDPIEITLTDENKIVITPKVTKEPLNKELFNHLKELVSQAEKTNNRHPAINYGIKGDELL